jgi:hypothetical protein
MYIELGTLIVDELGRLRVTGFGLEIVGFVSYNGLYYFKFDE